MIIWFLVHFSPCFSNLFQFWSPQWFLNGFTQRNETTGFQWRCSLMCTAWIYPPGKSVCENSRDSLSNPRLASQMWEVDSDWSKAHVINDGLFDWIWLWITCTWITENVTFSHLRSRAGVRQAIARVFPDWIVLGVHSGYGDADEHVFCY